MQSRIQSRGWVRAGALVAAAAVAVPAAAKMLPPGGGLDQPPLIQLESTTAADARRSTATGQVLAWYDVDAAVAGETPEAMARDFLAAHADEFGLADAELGDLEHFVTRTSVTGHNVHFIQHVSGIPVYQARIVVHISPNDRVTHVANGYRQDVAITQALPLVGAEAVVAAVRSVIGSDWQALEPELVVYPAAPVAHLAWQFKLLSPRGGEREAVIDALSGNTLVLWDSAVHATGQVFDPDPLATTGTYYGDPITDAGDENYPEIEAATVLVDLGDLPRDQAGQYSLTSAWAQLGDYETPNTGFFRQSSPDYIFTRDQDGFEAANVFYHIDKSMRHVNEYLGLGIRPYQYEHGVLFDPHGLDGDDNSHYVTSTAQLAFGEGCVDDSEDGDVIWHELGHGLHDWVTVGGLSNLIDGMSEGFGDYWAQSYSRSLGQWGPDDEAYDWVFSWDGHNECWGGRVTNYDLPYPAGVQPYPFIHTSGQIFSTCMMKIYDQIGRDATDTIVLEGLGMTTTYSTQNDAANGIMQAALDLGLESADVVATTLQSCGYLVYVSALGGSPSGDQDDAADVEGEERKAPVTQGGALGWLALSMLALGGLRMRRRRR